MSVNYLKDYLFYCRDVNDNTILSLMLENEINDIISRTIKNRYYCRKKCLQFVVWQILKNKKWIISFHDYDVGSYFFNTINRYNNYELKELDRSNDILYFDYFSLMTNPNAIKKEKDLNNETYFDGFENFKFFFNSDNISLYSIEFDDFEKLFKCLYLFGIGEDIQDFINIPDTDNDCRIYFDLLDFIYGEDVINNFLRLYFFIDARQQFKHQEDDTVKSTQYNGCTCCIGQENPKNNLISLNITNPKEYFIHRCDSKYQKNGYHNIRDLRHLIVHGAHMYSQNLDLTIAKNRIQTDFKEILHLMISYLNKELW